MLPRELLRRVRRIEIATNRAVNTQLAGGYHSVFRGQGMSFEEVRPYAPGDDIRAIDWNVSARTGKPFIKVFSEERELTVWLLIDASASTRFASRGRLKSHVAAELAALIAFSAIKNNDRVGVMLFTDRVERMIPPRKGRSHVLRVIRDVLAWQAHGTRTNLAAALETIHRVSRRRAVVFVLSDFLDGNYDRALAIASKRNDVIPIVLTDPLDNRLPDVGLMLAEDPETGERAFIDTASPAVRAAFEKRASDHANRTRDLFRRLALDAVFTTGAEDHVAPLVALFQRRAKRLGAG